MTEATFTSPRLERPREAPLAGVCLALARTTGTDVVLWRVLFVVLTVFGGLGVALYLACYVSIPVEAEEHSLVSRLLHGPDRTVTTKQVLLLALVLVVAVAALHDNGGAVVVAGLAGIGFLWWRRRHPSPVPGLFTTAPATPAAPAAAAPPDAAGTATTTAVPTAPTAVLPPYQPPVWAPPAPKPRSVITPLTLSVGALTVGVLLAVAAGGTASIPTEVVLAVALGVVGLGLVASAFFGRARGLVPVAILLALGLGGTFAARPAIDHGIGEREWSATTSGDYRLGIGHGTVTLPAAAPDGGHVEARVTFGQLTVLVPEGLHVVVNADVTNGDIQGFDVDENGRRAKHTFDLGPKGTPALVVDAHVGAGMVEVKRA
jgi:phage shock protein PspC (stress-responsive transcriptional regulator)